MCTASAARCGPVPFCARGAGAAGRGDGLTGRGRGQGRAGTTGTAYTLFTAANARATGQELHRILSENGQEITPEFDLARARRPARAREGGGGGRGCGALTRGGARS